MFKLALLSTFIIIASAKLKDSPNLYDYLLFENTNNVEHSREFLDKIGKVVLNSRKDIDEEGVWVLDLNDVESLRLRPATKGEEDEFFPVSKTENNRANRPRNPKRIKKDDPGQPAPTEQQFTEANEQEMKAKIIKIINKFALSTSIEPDSYLNEDTENDGPSLKLFFKGPHTSLVLRSYSKQWHYIIGPSSIFPEWFYEDHENISREGRRVYVEVPNEIKAEFYATLLHMLTMFLSFPV